MAQVIFEFGDLQVIQRGDKYFARYDAGAHQIVMREDEISPNEASHLQLGKDEMNQTLFAIQKRLIATGVDPYVSNLPRS